MIKIIKLGKTETEFRLTCDNCGCIFEYGVEDIYDSLVKCPTCGKTHYGFQDTKLDDIKLTTPVADYDCSNCESYKKSSQPGFIYVGDTPCQWCSKSPYRVTSTINSYTVPTYTYDQYVEQGDSKIGKFYTCTAEGVSYEFEADRLGTYEVGGVSIELPKNQKGKMSNERIKRNNKINDQYRL